MKSYKGIKPDIKELLSYRYRAKALKLFANQKVNTVNAGSKASKAKGRGMDFDEVRHYQPGDDIRLMHWSLTARLGKPFTKVYHEERERTMYLVVDQSATMAFGTRECFKSVKMANATALIGFGALEAHEKVGGIIFDDGGYNFYPAKQDKSALLKMLNHVTNDTTKRQITTDKGLSDALKFLYAKIRSNSVIIVLGDFDGFDDQAQQYLKLLAKKNEIINIFSYDPMEKELPAKDVYNFSNGKENLVLDAANTKQYQAYSDIYNTRHNAIKNFSRQYQMAFFEIATNDDLVKTMNYGVAGHGK
jgi:uncharacterized protein (DUF58 family)